MSEFAGPTHSAEDYVNALNTAMEQEDISDRMKAVKILLDSVDSETLQTIIDLMNDEQLDYFLKLQSSVLDGTLEQMNEISYQEQKDKEEEEKNSSPKSVKLLNFIIQETPSPELFAGKIKEFIEKASDTAQTVFDKTQINISNLMNYISNTIENIQYFVGKVLSNNEISDDDKMELVKHLYNEKGYLLLTYKDGKFIFDSALNTIIFDKVLELVKKQNENVRGTGDMPLTQPIYENSELEIKATQQSDNQLKRTMSAPGRMQPNLIEKIKKFEATLKKDFYGLLPQQLIKHDPRHKRKREEEEEENLKKERKEEPTGGKSRRKISRNKKAKTKKRKVNKKTKKRKRKMKTKKTKRKTNKRRIKK